jgi:hypothetical protein
VIVQPDGDVQMTPRAGNEEVWGDRVEVAWYGSSIKVTILGATPAGITQAYMTGTNDQDVIVEISCVVPQDNGGED